MGKLRIVVIGLICLCGAMAAWTRQEPKKEILTTPQTPTNRLIQSTSPYLLQHAHNPVDWYPWGEEAFAKARKENKPVFLSIGYSACHWCHVMERESFVDAGIAKLLNDNFVAIKVDREERPDLDDIYMSAVQMMAGRGGWPMSVFLTPDARPFFGGTYFPRNEFADLLRRVQEVWADPDKRRRLALAANEIAERIGQRSSLLPTGGTAAPELLTDAAKGLLAGFDPKYGGFGKAPKFPPAVRLSFLLAMQRKKPDPAALKVVTVTLDQMARGGMYDQIGGGFHRYSTDERWLVPHFEKMLYDNALLATTYLEAFRLTGNASYRRIATETLDFVLRELRDPKGGFWSTLDADSEGEEGRYYVWTPQEIEQALGKVDGALFCRLFDITTQGNFESKNIPNLLAKPLADYAKESGTSPAALQTRINSLRAKLMAVRAKRIRPHLDDKVLTNWNGLMLRALALGYDVTGETRYREAAEKAADFLLTTMRQEGRLLHVYRQGKTRPEAFLEDYSYLTVGLLELHRATGSPRWLKETQALVATLNADFRDAANGSYFDTPKQHETLLARLNSAEDNATPSGQAMAAQTLVRLSRLTGDASYREQAVRLLNNSTAMMRRFPTAMPAMLLAAHAYFTPDATPAVSGKPEPVKASLVSAPTAVVPGQIYELEVRFAIAPGWHINADKPADPTLIPTQVRLASGPFQMLAVTYPPAQSVVLGFAAKPLRVFQGETVVRLRLKALPGAEKVGTLRLTVRYQACDEKACQPPLEVLLTASLKRKK